MLIHLKIICNEIFFRDKYKLVYILMKISVIAFLGEKNAENC